MPSFQRYYESIHFLEGLGNLPLEGDYMIDSKHAEVYLKRMRYFLELIGNPDKDLKYIHIAGTSGKGSVTTMLHEILLSAGKKVGSFTSPSVTTSIEKIKVGKSFISPKEFAEIVDYLKPFIDEAYINGPYGRPSYFEIFLTIAFIYFKKTKTEWVVLEVGLGGRFDATNVILEPLVTAITNIDLDHTELLGKTLKKIAFDKAGIIKTNCIFFTTEKNPSILKLFKQICNEKKVICTILSSDITNYKKDNELLVAEIARHIGISSKNILNGIKATQLMCRFEAIQSNPLVILDGAHNRAKVATTIHNLSNLKYKRLFLIVGISDNKDHISILEQIIPKADKVFFTRFENRNRKCAHPKSLLSKSKKYLRPNATTSIFLDPNIALSTAIKEADINDAILIVGSFFLAGELRKNWISEEHILRNRTSFIK